MGHLDRLRGHNPLYKMNIATWLSLILGVITLSTPASTSEPRVVCYYTNWSVYRPGTARFNPQNINPYLCTHLIYAFGGFTKDNTLKPFDKYQDIEKGGYAKFTGLKTYNKNLKTLLAIGGWNEGSTRFSPMVASKERRKEFVRNVIKFLRQNRFDGLDLDWEYPAFRDGGKPKDRENYAKLVRELREEFDREADKTGKARLLLTMAVPAGIEYIEKGFDVKTLNQHLDWMNLLTYDYHSAFEPAVNHHAPLYPLEEPNEYSVDTELNIDYTIKYYLENGADRDKLVLGIPTYGRSYTLFNADAVEIGAPADGPGEQGDATREKGYLAYYEICEALKPKEKKRSTDEDSEEDSEEEEEEWTVMYPNPSAMGPVAFKGNQWVGYDDMDIVRKKAEYVAENGLGGIMFWSIDNDDFRGNCHEKPYPLIEAAKEAYLAKLSSSDLVVTEGPKTRPSAKRRNRPKSSTTTTTPKPPSAAKSNKRKSSVTSTTPAWNITPEPPTTPDPGSDFKCTDEGFFPHPRDCKKYFWCLDSGPSNLGIVAHQFTCPSGLFFNKAADSCDFARNVLCKMPASTTKAPATKPPSTPRPTSTTTSATTRKPIRLSTKSSVLFRTTTTTTPEPETEEEYEDEVPADAFEEDAEDPRVIKELIDLIKKVGGVEQLEKQLHLAESSATSASGASSAATTPAPFNKKLYQKVLERARGNNKYTGKSISEEATAQNSRRGPQNQGLEPTEDKNRLLKKDRPQYTTINRQRAQAPPEPEDSGEEPAQSPAPAQPPSRARAVETESARPLQYVNIRRARPTTSDTADDTASRNALFERAESYVTVSQPNSLDIASARRENQPEYVTIRRQRPTTEETTTLRFEDSKENQEVELQETALEREISSQPQYTSIVRTRATTPSPDTTTSEQPRTRPTTPVPEVPSSPEPTTVLAVAISSLLNAPSSDESPSIDTTVSQTTEEVTTSTTTTTTAAPSTASTRRPAILRRRGSTTTTVAPLPSSSTTQPRRQFLRRTTPPQDTVNTDPEEKKLQTSQRGPSKFTRREEVPKNDTRRVGVTRRTERPRGFVRRRPEGTSSSTTAPSSSVGTVTRRPFRIASRRRPPTSSVATTTTSAPTTIALESDEFLQDIGDIDAIEDPALEPRTSKKPAKTQRRPLVNLKETAGKNVDQNPSATNEETKRQSKKYSSTFRQNQLDGLLKKEDATTEGTTVDDAEAALALATHQLITAPLPSSTEDEEPRTRRPTTDNTVTPTDYTQTQTFKQYRVTGTDTTAIDTGKVTLYPRSYEATHTYTPTNFDTTESVFAPVTGYTGFQRGTFKYDIEKTVTGTDSTATYTPNNDFESSDGTTKSLLTPDVTGYTSFQRGTFKYDIEKSVTGTDSTAIHTSTNDFETPAGTTKSLSTPDVTGYTGFQRGTFKYDMEKTVTGTDSTATHTPNNDFESPDGTTKSLFSTSDVTGFTGFQRGTFKYDIEKSVTGTDSTATYTPNSDFETPAGTTKSFSNPDITGYTGFQRGTYKYDIDKTVNGTETFTPTNDFETLGDTTKSFSNPDITGYTGFQRGTYKYDTTPTEVVFTTPGATKYSTSDVTGFTGLPRGTFTTVEVTETPTSTFRTTFGETQTPSGTFRSRYEKTQTPTNAFEFTTPGTTKSEATGYTGMRRGGVKYTEYATPSPTQSYVRQDPTYFTKDILESPVTKTYNDEYQYISSTTPQIPRKVFRKKIQRRISTTLRPSTVALTEETISPDGRAQYSPRSSSPRAFEPIVTSPRTYERKTSPQSYEPEVTSPRTYQSRLSSPTYVPRVTASREYRTDTTDADFTPEVTNSFLPEVTATVNYIPEATGRSYIPDNTARNYIPEGTGRSFLAQVTSRNYVPEVTSKNYIDVTSKNYVETTSTRNYLPEVTSSRAYLPKVTTPKPFEKVNSKKTYKPVISYDYYDDSAERVALKYAEGTKVILHGKGSIECLDVGNFPHPSSCKKFISCARMEFGSLLGWEYVCPKGLSFDPVGGICNWSAGLGCDEKDH